VWVDKAIRTALTSVVKGTPVFITDARYYRDLVQIKKAGGIILQVHRTQAGLQGLEQEHPSEREMEFPAFQALVDYHITNDGSLEDLHQQVQVLSLKLRGTS
jgi:hypothetical protein